MIIPTKNFKALNKHCDEFLKKWRNLNKIVNKCIKSQGILLKEEVKLLGSVR